MIDEDKEVLIVGNGPSALGSEAGNIIDQFPNVARFNDFRTSGYEKHVGTKCDFWITCEPLSTTGKDCQRIYFYSPNGKGLDTIRDRLPGKDIVQIPCWAREEVMDMGFGKNPTSGAVASYYFSKIFGKVYIYGFDFLNPNKRHHYFDNRRRKTSKFHSSEDEENYFRRMLDNGGLIWLNGSQDKETE